MEKKSQTDDVLAIQGLTVITFLEEIIQEMFRPLLNRPCSDKKPGLT